MRVLHSEDRIYQWAEKYNLKVMMDIHGMPGSQSGVQSSGCTIIGEEGDHHFYFNTTWNKADWASPGQRRCCYASFLMS